MYYKSQSIAISIENMLLRYSQWQFLLVSIRIMEHKYDGYISYLDLKMCLSYRSQYPAFGINSKYVINEGTSIYGGISQAYRPCIIKDIVPASST